jgi:hypothetical protein
MKIFTKSFEALLILRAPSDVTMCTEVGEEIKRRFTEVIIYELEKLESSKILL